MGKIDPQSSVIVRNASTGRSVTVRGAGSLKGRLPLQRGVDLTKPIFEQISKSGRTSQSKR